MGRTSEPDVVASWFSRARSASSKVALADAEDPRVISAAVRLRRESIARPTLVGTGLAIREQLAAVGEDPLDYVIHDVEAQQGWAREGLATIFAARNRSVDDAALDRMASSAVCASALLVATDEADVAVAGSMRKTSEVLLAALRIIGSAEGVESISSCFLMSHLGRNFAFGDCGVIPEPTAEQLAHIATATARTFSQVTQEEPYVAMLSFSTHGSAEHASVERVRAATDLVRRSTPTLAIDGELQFDAAFDPEVARTKTASSPVAGRANVFVFPDLNAANIGYKIAQRVGGASAYGPLLQGLSRPMHDVSRGCAADDIVVVSALGALQSSAAAGRSDD